MGPLHIGIDALEDGIEHGVGLLGGFLHIHALLLPGAHTVTPRAALTSAPGQRNPEGQDQDHRDGGQGPLRSPHFGSSILSRSALPDTIRAMLSADTASRSGLK
ncbi:hypothetical protein GCM10010264_59390 [Streptomyces globisporus]|nr:hypothetical protein GCM10010264_59390 [Streptomyces globisporus]